MTGFSGTGRRGSGRGSGVDVAATLEGPPEGHLIGVFKITTDGRPLASRPTRTPMGQQAAQVGGGRLPSRFGSVAKITSVTVPSASRRHSSRILRSAGPIPSIGLIAPPKT